MHPKIRLFTLCLAALLLFVAACKQDEYIVEMRPDGNTMQRTVTVEVSGEGLDRLSALYGTVPDEHTLAALEDERTVEATVTADFTARMPDDIGGNGYLLYYESPLGSSSIYTEEFRGYDDLAVMITSQRLAFDRLLDVLLLWFECEFGDEPGFADVHAFLDTGFREDIWNIVLLANAMDTMGPVFETGDDYADSHLGMNYSMRVLHFLADRDYIDPLDLLSIDQAFAALDSGNERPALEMLAVSISRKLGTDDVPGALNKLTLATDEELAASWETFKTESKDLTMLVRSWLADEERHNAGSLDEEEILNSLMDQMGGFELFDTSSGFLDVTLHLTEEPYESNGHWNGGDSLSWEQPLASTHIDAADLPNVLYAAWSVPNVEAQQAHFGGVIIDDDDLLHYTLWYRALDSEHRTQWDDFVQGLSPGAELAASLHSFRFDDETAMPQADDTVSFRSIHARRALTLIDRGLKDLADSPDAATELEETN